MKRIFVLPLLLFVSVCFAQNNSTQWIDHISFGSTNVFSDLACDDQGNTYSVGAVNETTGQWDMGLAIAKYDNQGSVVWRKSFAGQYPGDNDFFIEAYNGNIYVVALIQGALDINSNTTITSQNQNQDFLVMKLTSDGTPVWWNFLGIPGDDEMFQVWFDEGNLMIMVERGNYNYDGVFIGNVPNYKHGVVRINEDGTFHSLSASSGTTYNPVFADAISSTETEIWWRASGPAPVFAKMLVKGNSDVNGNFTGTDTIDYRVHSQQTTFNFEKCRRLLDNSGYILAVTGYDYDWGSDTITRPSNNFGHQVLKLNNDLTLDNYIQLSVFRDFALNDNQIAIQGTAQPSLLIGSDSLYTDYISTGGHPLSSCVTYITDHDFTPIRYFQVSSADGSFDHEGLDFDPAGYVVSQYTEAKDIFWGDTIIEAALQSWKHLTVIGKEGDGSTSIAENTSLDELSIYPNPTRGSLTIANLQQGEVNRAELFDLQGKRVLSQRLSTPTLDVSHLPSGTYLLWVSNGSEVSKVKKVVLY